MVANFFEKLFRPRPKPPQPEQWVYVGRFRETAPGQPDETREVIFNPATHSVLFFKNETVATPSCPGLALAINDGFFVPIIRDNCESCWSGNGKQGVQARFAEGIAPIPIEPHINRPTYQKALEDLCLHYPLGRIAADKEDQRDPDKWEPLPIEYRVALGPKIRLIGIPQDTQRERLSRG